MDLLVVIEMHDLDTAERSGSCIDSFGLSPVFC